jgi:hypothetical protein
MKRSYLLLSLVMCLALLLSSCSFLGQTILPNTEYQALVAEKDKYKADLDAAKITIEADVKTAEENATTISDLNFNNEKLTAKIVTFNSMLCEQSWDEFQKYTGLWELFWSPDQTPVGIRVYYSQWTAPGLEWNDYLPGTTLIWDDDGTQAFILDTANDCIIPNPALFDLDPPVQHSSS